MTGLIIFGVLAAVMAAIGLTGYLLVRRVGRGPEDKTHKVDGEKLKEWSAAAESYDASRAQAEQKRESEAWKTVQSAVREARRLADGVMSVDVRCASLAEYRGFDAEKWFAEHMDESDAVFWADLSDRTLEAWRGTRDKLDLGCAMAMDEPPGTRDACLEAVASAAADLSGDLVVRYSYADPASSRRYNYARYIPRDRLLAIAGRRPDPDEGPDGHPVGRNKILAAAGYRCSRCGRSPLSGIRLKAWDDGGTGECTCDGCKA